MAHLAEGGVSPKTIKCYLAAIRHAQIALGLRDPQISGMAKLEQVIKGAKRTYAGHAQDRRVRLPITPNLLLKMKAVWEKNAGDFDTVMLWAASCLCYFGFLRAGEITVPSESAYDKGQHLNFADVAVDSVSHPKIMKVRIKASKTDPFRKGVDIFLGRTSNKLCPVSAGLAYLARRGSKEGMLFRFEDGRLLTRERFVAGVRAALSAAGVDCRSYSGHSFRIGAATAAARHNLPPATIKTLGRWESSAYLLYTRINRQELAGISQVISR